MSRRRSYLKYLTFLIGRKSMSTLGKSSTESKPAIILGIETSCDDTGCGIVNTEGKILGEAIHSQIKTHITHGGIIPAVARQMHIQNISKVCESALKSANLRLTDVDAIATTVAPGLPLSLLVGRDFGVYLSRIGSKPFIPIHHMQAHALTARLIDKVDYPFLALLISGGHSMIVLVERVDKYYIFGSSRDNTPGELIDKIARRLKLHNIPEYQNLSGGQALERAAIKATSNGKFLFKGTMSKKRDCTFSFSGIACRCFKHIVNEESTNNIIADMLIPDVYNLSYDVQMAITMHICNRVQRAIEFVNQMSLIPKDKQTLVIGGGVASNNFIANALSILCSKLNYRFVRTPPRLCTDNGVMIAWNGVEKWLAGVDIMTDRNEIENVEVNQYVPIGEDWTKKVEYKNIKCENLKIEKSLRNVIG